MDMRYLTRNVNEGFSGGEKKRNEILQARRAARAPAPPPACARPPPRPRPAPAALTRRMRRRAAAARSWRC
jgi:hypothetical protein